MKKQVSSVLLKYWRCAHQEDEREGGGGRGGGRGEWSKHKSKSESPAKPYKRTYVYIYYIIKRLCVCEYITDNEPSSYK